MIPDLHRVQILRPTYVKGQLKQPGDIVELDTPDFNAFLHFGKGKAVAPVSEPPKPDERETELQERMSKRSQPKPRKTEVTDNG